MQPPVPVTCNYTADLLSRHAVKAAAKCTEGRTCWGGPSAWPASRRRRSCSCMGAKGGERQHAPPQRLSCRESLLWVTSRHRKRGSESPLHHL